MSAARAIRKRPRQARSKMTVDAILQATRELLIKFGYAKLSTNKVAERAGVSIGSLYQYFPNKDAIVLELVEQVGNRRVEALFVELERLQIADLGIREGCRQLLRVTMAVHAVDPQLNRVLAEEVPRMGQADALKKWLGAVETMVEAKLADRADELRPENLKLAAFLVVRAVHGVTFAAVTDRDELFTDERFADEMADMVSRYLLKDDAPSEPLMSEPDTSKPTN